MLKVLLCSFMFMSNVAIAQQTQEKPKTLEETKAQFDAEFKALTEAEAIEVCMILTHMGPSVKDECAKNPQEECKIALPMLEYATKACADRDAARKAKKT